MNSDTKPDATDAAVVPYSNGDLQTTNSAPVEGVTQANPYALLSDAPFPEQVTSILHAPVNPDDVLIRPDGPVYLSGGFYHNILTRAFGAGAAVLVPVEPNGIRVDDAEHVLYYHARLYVYGRFVTEAIGEQKYHPDSGRMSWGDTVESARTNCIMRCCKHMGVTMELWDRTWTEQWKAEHAIEVWCANRERDGNPRKKKMWRKKSDPPIDIWPWKEDDSQAPRAQGARREPVARQRPVAAVHRPADAEDAEWEFPSEPQAGTVTKTPPAKTAPAKAAPAKAAAGNEALISFPQGRRFRDIAKAAGWTPDEIRLMISKFGYENVEEIRRTDYKRMCDALDNREAHSRITAEIEAPAEANGTITSQQVSAFKQHAADNLWSHAMYMALLRQHDIESVEAIPADLYSHLHNRLTDAGLHARIKQAVNQSMDELASNLGMDDDRLPGNMRQSEPPPAKKAVNRTSTTPDAAVISEARVKALRKAFTDEGWSADAARAYLGSLGYEKTADVQDRDYARVRKAVMDSAVRDEYEERAALQG